MGGERVGGREEDGEGGERGGGGEGRGGGGGERERGRRKREREEQREIQYMFQTPVPTVSLLSRPEVYIPVTLKSCQVRRIMSTYSR